MHDFMNVIDADFEDIVGQEDTKQQMKSALLTRRNIIIVGPPGIGKTTLAKNIAALIPSSEVNDCGFNCNPKSPSCPSCQNGAKPKRKIATGSDLFIRVQGSPDLTAEDLIGDIDPQKAMTFGPLSKEAFMPGKIFRANNGILFFDEINRASEKLQNTLLQALEEKKVTIGSYSVDLRADFIFIGTMNPEDSSTEPLSDVFLDRFDFIFMTYPETVDKELLIVKKHGKMLLPFPEKLLHFIISFIHSLRHDPGIEKKPSVRSTLGIYERAQSIAMIRKKKEVGIEDVKSILISVLGHRMRLKPSLKFITSPEAYIEEQFKKFNERGDCL